MDNFDNTVEKIVKETPRYAKGAYYFVREALEFTIKNQMPSDDLMQQASHHISGGKLLEGIRDYTLLQYGPMAITVFNRWNIKNCEDFGNIVFNLVDYGVLGKTDTDSIADFKNGYDFYEAFQKPFLPHNSPDAHNKF